MIKNFPISEEAVWDILNGLLEMWDPIPGTDTSYLEVLCEYYADEMPYGVMKARTGDPDEWIYHRLEREFANA